MLLSIGATDVSSYLDANSVSFTDTKKRDSGFTNAYGETVQNVIGITTTCNVNLTNAPSSIAETIKTAISENDDIAISGDLADENYTYNVKSYKETVVYATENTTLKNLSIAFERYTAIDGL